MAKKGSGSATRSGKVSVPKISGTERQIVYAKDILMNPYNTMTANVKLFEGRIKKYNLGENSRENKQVAAYKAASRRYAESVSELPKEMKARDIIDKAYGIRSVASNILADEYKKRGLNPLDAQRF